MNEHSIGLDFDVITRPLPSRAWREVGAADMKTKKQAKAIAKETSRSFSAVVGADTYEVWVRMLSELVPDGRTRCLAVMLAGMLQYAAVMAAANGDEEEDERSLATSLFEATEVSDPSEVKDL